MEPKDKNSCNSIISAIDWSIDGRLICVTSRNQNKVIVWDINTCQRKFVFDGKKNDFGMVSMAYFYCLNSDYLLVSGDRKTQIVSINDEKEESILVS